MGKIMKIKQIIALLIAVAVTAGLFVLAGCGSEQTHYEPLVNNSVTTAATTVADTVATTTPAPVYENYTVGYKTDTSEGILLIIIDYKENADETIVSKVSFGLNKQTPNSDGSVSFNRESSFGYDIAVTNGNFSHSFSDKATIAGVISENAVTGTFSYPVKSINIDFTADYSVKTCSNCNGSGEVGMGSIKSACIDCYGIGRTVS
ncbi:MAG: zinc finger-like domain-containing protein [Oscillospiraceae bacterium]|nr:zinc finger-like domain-containing protein [Oscillospiraceae bacterium]